MRGGSRGLKTPGSRCGSSRMWRDKNGGWGLGIGVVWRLRFAADQLLTGPDFFQPEGQGNRLGGVIGLGLARAERLEDGVHDLVHDGLAVGAHGVLQVEAAGAVFHFEGDVGVDGTLAREEAAQDIGEDAGIPLLNGIEIDLHVGGNLIIGKQGDGHGADSGTRVGAQGIDEIFVEDRFGNFETHFTAGWVAILLELSEGGETVLDHGDAGVDVVGGRGWRGGWRRVFGGGCGGLEGGGGGGGGGGVWGGGGGGVGGGGGGGLGRGLGTAGKACESCEERHAEKAGGECHGGPGAQPTDEMVPCFVGHSTSQKLPG